MAIRRHGRLSASPMDDSDLHVDVMRFFAIVALCLFAILPHTESPTPRHETLPLQSVAPQASIQSALSKSTRVPESPLAHLSPTADDRPMRQLVQAPSMTADAGGVRFMDANTFTAAVKNGSIRLVVHHQDANFVFDAAGTGFTRVEDMPMQLFGLAASEVPELFQQVVPKQDGVQQEAAQWFITLPKRTLAHLLDVAANSRATTILNERALPI